MSVPKIASPSACKGSHSGLGRAVDAVSGTALVTANGCIQHNHTSGRHQRKRLLYREEKPFDVRAKQRVEEFFSDGPEGTKPGGTRVRENHVQPPLQLLNLGKKTIKIFQSRNIALNGAHILADLALRVSEVRFAPPCNKDIGAFANEPLSGRQADARGSPSYQGDLACQLSTRTFSRVHNCSFLPRSALP